MSWNKGGKFEAKTPDGRIVYTPTFPSWDAFIKQVCEPAPQCGIATKDNVDGHDWSTRTFEECINLARNGWPDGRAKLARFKGVLDNIVAGGGYKPEAVFSEAGAEVDVGRFLDGEPECMTDFQLREFNGGRGGRIVKFLVNVTSSSGIREDKAFIRGAVAMAFIDALERFGYRVELWVGEVGLMSSKSIFIRTCLKRANEDYELDRIAFALCHPSVQRRMFFRIYEQLPADKWNTCGGDQYGGGGAFNDPDPEVIEMGLLWHVAQQGDITDEESVRREFDKVLKQFGLEVETT